MMNYVKMDNDTKQQYMAKLDNLNIPALEKIESVFDLGITTEERIQMGIPERHTYLMEIADNEELALLHIAQYKMVFRNIIDNEIINQLSDESRNKLGVFFMKSLQSKQS